MTIRIEPTAFGPVKAVAAEHVVAHSLSEKGGEPTLYRILASTGLIDSIPNHAVTVRIHHLPDPEGR